MRVIYTLFFFLFIFSSSSAAEDAKSDRTALAAILKNAHISQTDIKNVSNLEKMELGDDNQISYDPVSGRIVGLKLHLTEFNDLSLVANLKELKVLIIHGNEENEQINNLQGLEEITNLRVLSLREHKIQKIKGLQNLKNLEKLDLSMNEISKMEGIENLKNLRKLELGDNKLSKIENLNSLTYLEELYLQRNQILKLEFCMFMKMIFPKLKIWIILEI